MEVTILEGTKNQLRFELDEINHTLCNALKMELWEHKNVHVAGYKIKHPLVGKTTFLVEVSSGDPKKIVQEALASLKKKVDEAAKTAAKL